MNTEQMKDILLTQYEKISTPKDLVERELLHKIREFEKTPFIIIISGVRRCGKSCLLNQIWSEKAILSILMMNVLSTLQSVISKCYMKYWLNCLEKKTLSVSMKYRIYRAGNDL